MIIVGVVTLPTYMSDDCLSHCSGASRNGLSKKLLTKSGMSVVPAMLSQLVTGQRTAAPAKRVVWPMTQLESTPPPLHPAT
jgi:hypothetical protein